jgi:hypothetical protein
MFSVVAINDSGLIRQVYAVRELQELEFLIYNTGHWKWMPARYYKPYIEVLEGK